MLTRRGEDAKSECGYVPNGTFALRLFPCASFAASREPDPGILHPPEDSKAVPEVIVDVPESSLHPRESILAPPEDSGTHHEVFVAPLESSVAPLESFMAPLQYPKKPPEYFCTSPHGPGTLRGGLKGPAV